MLAEENLPVYLKVTVGLERFPKGWAIDGAYIGFPERVDAVMIWRRRKNETAQHSCVYFYRSWKQVNMVLNVHRNRKAY